MTNGITLIDNKKMFNIQNNIFSKNYVSVAIRITGGPTAAIVTNENNFYGNTFNNAATTYSPGPMKKYLASTTPLTIQDFKAPITGMYINLGIRSDIVHIGKMGTGLTNKFDGLRNGIITKGININVQNAEFKNINQQGNGFVLYNGNSAIPQNPLISSACAGIMAYDDVASRQATINCYNITSPSLSPNISFINCNYGIFSRSTLNATNSNAYKNAEIDARYCTFSSNQYGVQYTAPAIGKVNVEFNTFTNSTVRAVDIIKSGAGSFYSPSLANGANIININQNTFNDPTIRTAGWAIHIINASGSALDAINGVKVSVNENTIDQHELGIYLFNMPDIANLSANTMTLRNIYNATGIQVENSANTNVVRNNISTEAPNLAALAPNVEQCGILTINSLGIKVQCNTMERIYANLVFDNACTSVNGVVGNFMKSGYRGFVLQNSGTIGQQGSAGSNSYNSWGPSANFPAASGAFKTYMWFNPTFPSFDPNVSSKMFMTTPPLNTENGSTGPQIQKYTTGTGLIATSAQNTDPCGSIQSQAANIAPATASTSTSTTTANSASFVPLAYSTVNQYNSPEDRFEAQSALYKYLRGNSSISQANSSLQNFCTNNQTSCMGKLYEVENLVKQGQISQAITKNNLITTNTTIESLNKQYNALYLSLAQNPALVDDASFKASVQTIADACEKNGLVVKKARALAQYLNPGTNLVFANNCSNGNKLLNNTQNNEEGSNVKSDALNHSYLILPNPNDGYFSIYNPKISEKQILDIKLLDITSKVIYSAKHEMMDNFCKFDLSQVKKGIYLLRINDASISKLVIQ